MKRTKKKLQLNSQTVARLSAKQLADVRGGTDFWLCTEAVSGCDAATQGSVRTNACEVF